MMNDIYATTDVCISLRFDSNTSHLSEVGPEKDEDEVKGTLRDIVIFNLVMEDDGEQYGHFDMRERAVVGRDWRRRRYCNHPLAAVGFKAIALLVLPH